MTKIFNFVCLIMFLQIAAPAQTIAVNPTGVNVNSQNPTTVFLTFGRIPPGYVPAEAIWCGEIVPAAPPALGFECRPDTIYGALPARFDRSTPSGNNGFTDIMAIPPSVVRRAYQAAVGGASAGFFYVRRFVSTDGQPDQFVNVTCRMTGGGARVPFALTGVEIKTPSKEPILFVKSGEKFPEVVANIQYNGTGRLKGRWEIVQPGEEPPTDEDLLTEATLPLERRAAQRRFTQIERFNHFLPPIGKFQLKLEDARRVPVLAEGQYILLLRIEATNDKESDSDLNAINVGSGVVHSGAVASFPMPTLKFFVSGGGGFADSDWAANGLIALQNDEAADLRRAPVFAWKELPGTSAYRLEIFGEGETSVLSAITRAPTTFYRAPSWFWTRFAAKNPSWRVVALAADGKIVNRTKTQKIPVGR